MNSLPLVAEQRQSTVVTFVTSPDIRFTLQNRPYNRVRLVGHGEMVAISLPVLDLDLTTDEPVAEILGRLRNAFRTNGRYHDEEGLPIDHFYLAGRQGTARQIEAAHELLVKGDVVMHVWQGMHPAVADAILTAISKWHSKPVAPSVTGSTRASNLHDTLVINDPELDVVPVVVTRRFVTNQGQIQTAMDQDMALLDVEADLLYFDDYVASAAHMLEGAEGQLVNAFVIEDTEHLTVTRNANVLDESNGKCIYKHDEVVTQASVARDCVSNWLDTTHRQQMMDASPVKRQSLAYSDKDYRYYEAEVYFDECFEARIGEMVEDARLEHMKIVERPQFDTNEQEDQYTDFTRLVERNDVQDLPRNREGNVIVRPMLKYNVNKPGQWQIVPKAAKWIAAKLDTQKGCMAFKKREAELKAEEAAKPLGTVVTVTPYERAAHDERAKTVYVGQTWKMQEGSKLANGPIGDAAAYRKWLWQCIQANTPAIAELKELAAHLLTGSALYLVAWPLARKDMDPMEKRALPAPAYANIIAQAAEWMAGQLKAKQLAA